MGMPGGVAEVTDEAALVDEELDAPEVEELDAPVLEELDDAFLELSVAVPIVPVSEEIDTFGAGHGRFREGRAPSRSVTR